LPSASKRDPARFSRAELEAWSGFLSTHATLIPAIDAALRAEQGLAFRDYDVLATLDMVAERRLPMSVLAERLVLSPSRLTRVVEAIEARGWIARQPGDDDARVTYATLTPAGLAALRRARRTHHAVVRSRFHDRLREPDLRTLARIWRRLGTIDPALDEALARLPED
jgi:DNA-binding MarR family transcriptional regulator